MDVSGLGFCRDNRFPEHLKHRDAFLAGHKGDKLFGMNSDACTHGQTPQARTKGLSQKQLCGSQ